MKDIVVKTRLRDVREDADLTQADVAAVLHIAQSTYSAYEAGTVNIPVTAIMQLADFYHTSTDFLLYRT